ncbi:Rad4-domain-containing protein [Lophiostoma macrostomum CBS 122681]|uniref:Rad4-domain-containing protein n=1 Tax=Lophiostoma macrostomum CBS 122681 TaxID=1314788 RepID=A0A6A6TKN8_9PLEO|nr:Rad4-domain-containing protein [Lophiostoma macrostomum CBS 122681]
MAGGRGRLHKPTGAATSATPKRTTRRGAASQDATWVPDVFHDLLSEATSSKAAGPEEDRKPLKKRKTALSTRPIPAKPADGRHPATSSKATPPRTLAEDAFVSSDKEDDEGSDARPIQTIIDSDESDESDLEWEDALGEGDIDEDENAGDEEEAELSDLSITIAGDKGKEKETTKKVRRRGITSVDKKRRLDIHKMHVLCLLYHVHRRNAWCNDGRVQAGLRKLPPPKILSNLVPNPEFNQYQASKRFIDGMNELKIMWGNKFKVTALGIHKPRWHDVDAEAQAFTDFDDLDIPMDRQDFRKAASSLQGSQDIGAQLFCALLRAIGVEARLVCSLQVLPFASAAQASTPSKPSSEKSTIHLDPYNNIEAPSPSKPKPKPPARPKRLSRLEKIMGERNLALSSGVAPRQKKKYHTAYPVYWVEALNPAHQKWVPIDPHSTFTVDKSDKLEPPLNSAQNSLVYAVAFEDDSVAKDVTRRYAKAYNAKTRKFRVECAEGGVKWWRRALKVFRRGAPLDRDQVEDAALARKEAAEGIPKNVQDFKDHPVYVLERHIKHNEVIHPLHQVGKVNVSSAMNPKMEPIYRRGDVHVVRSADKWYRLGRDVKAGEQPLKYAKPKKNARRSLPPDADVDMDEQEEVGAGLYAPFQTELYVAPPVIRGRVPRNAFGNLDLYVPSMVPPGGVHVPHKLASKAARIVGVDYADAVTGFSFKGRHGTAVVQGVVVAQEYKEAVEAALDAMEHAQVEAENAARTAEALRLWRKFYLGLKIAQRVNAIEIEGEKGPQINVHEELERQDKLMTEQQMAGGFFPDEGTVTEPPSRAREHYETSTYDEDDGGGFLPDLEDDDNQETRKLGLIRQDSEHFGSTLLSQQQLRPRQEEEQSGGFTTEDDGEDAGGFIREPSPPPHQDDMQGGFVQTDAAADDFAGGYESYAGQYCGGRTE